VSNVELDGHWLLPGKLIKRIATAVRAVVDRYKRQTKPIGDIDFRVRGYLSKDCIQKLQCPREEYRAQALAIRYANGIEGLGTDETSYYVDWEVRVKECARRSCGRFDILKHYNDDDLIISEVKRYRDESTTTVVDAQLRRYEQELRSYGLNVRRDPSFRNANGSGVIGAFVDNQGRTNVVWAPSDHIGHIYYAPVEELEDKAERGNEELEEVLQNAEVFIENPLEEERDHTWWCGLCILS